VIAPVRRNSRCIGILEVLSDKPGAFGDETLSALRRDALLVAELSDVEEGKEIKPAQACCESDRVPSEIAALGPQILATQTSSSLKAPPEAQAESFHSVVDVNPGSLDAAQLLRRKTEANRHPVRWIAFAAPIVLIGFSVPKLIRQIHPVEVVRSKGVQSSGVNRSSNLSPAAGSTATLHAQTLVASDSASVVDSLTKEARSGDVAAQVLLANRYSHGEGVGMDKVKATAWYIVAGANGDRQAKSVAVQMSHELSQFEIAQVRLNVGRMYRDGIGTSPDVIAAYSWFVLARAAGDARAKEEQQKLEHRMQPVQLSEARRRAAEWISSHHFRRSSAHKIVVER
jgi:hypothetical protein